MNQDIDRILQIIDKPLSEARPNYGYVEKTAVAEQILIMNEYLILDKQIVLDSLDFILNVKDKKIEKRDNKGQN